MNVDRIDEAGDCGWDAIVIGSGAGGSAAAYRLARAGLGVLLLEKGEVLPLDGSTLDIARVFKRGEFLSQEPWQDGRGRSIRPEEHFNVGGKTKWYGAALLRYAPHEFASDPAHACPGWPISYRDLEPYYAEAERLLGVRAFEVEPDLARIVVRLARVAPEWRAEPLPLGLSPEIREFGQEARHFDGFASARGLKADAETALLARTGAGTRLVRWTSAEVNELLPDARDPRRITGVRLADGRDVRARVTLLAAGALHSPRLLQRYLDRTSLGGRLPMSSNVGRNLKLHILTAMVSVTTSSQRDVLRKTLLLLNDRFPHSSIQPLGFDAELMSLLMPKFFPSFLARQIAARAYGFFLQTEDGASLDNRVVDPTPGSNALPMLDYDAARLPAALDEHRGLTRSFQRTLLRLGFVSVTQRIGLNGTAHVQGTLVAGSDPRTSVVDGIGRVHGLESLYVVDGSVLPRSSRVNPSLTIYAWALRVAEKLASGPLAGARSGVTLGAALPA